jgi:hypothetical protein
MGDLYSSDVGGAEASDIIDIIKTVYFYLATG